MDLSSPALSTSAVKNDAHLKKETTVRTEFGGAHDRGAFPGGLIEGKTPHSFLGAGHERSERKTWAVIWLCGAMMIAEILGGMLFGSIALVADGMHMSTHAGALLLAALAYTYARKYADDPRFTFGTVKFGDLAGFTSAIILVGERRPGPGRPAA